MQLTTWVGMQGIAARFEQAGSGLIRYFADLASGLCDAAFDADELLAEQYAIGERYVNDVFTDRSRREMGRRRECLKKALARLSPTDLLEKFKIPIYNFQIAEANEHANDDFEIVRKVHIRDYAESVSAKQGYSLQRKSKLVERRMIKSFGEWGLYGAFWIEVGGIDRSRPLSADLSFDVGVGQERRMESALGVGIVAEALLFYASIVKPRDFTKLPPPPDSETESRVAKHAIKAQLCFFNLLMEDLAETWCVEEGKER